MKKTTFSHTLLSLCLLFLISILGGGNAVNAQELSSVTLDFEKGSGTFPYNADWTITNLSVYSSLNHTTSGSNSASTSGKTSAVAKYNNKLENISKVVYYISKTTGNTNTTSYFLVETSTDGKKNWVDQGHSPTFKDIAQNKWTEVTVDLSTPVTGFVRVSYKGTTAERLIDDITVYYTPATVGSTDPELSYNPASDVVLSSNIAGWSAPELTSEVIGDLSSLSFTYSSDNETVAKVTSAGEISLTGTAGEAEISAKFGGDATYAAQTPTYKVNVFDPVTLDKEAGTYDNEVTVTLSAAGAQGIVYTTDGTDPTLSNGTKVEATYKELTFDATTTLKAISYYGATLSGVASAVYTIQKVLAVPTITPEGGTFNYEKKVTIASPGVAAIVYTLDGTDPKDMGEGAEMISGDSEEITITSSCTLKARTTDASMALFSEGLATADFIINLPKPIITLSAESTQEQPITVTIEAEGASHIYYSTDGTDPTATSSSVVEVDAATATFTLSEIGSYTIKAIALNSALDASDAATATCTISKVVPVPGSAAMKYKKVTSMDDIVDGGVYLLACPSRGYAMSFRYLSKAFTGTGVLSFPDGEDNILSVENLNTSNGPCEITLEKVADKENVYYLRYANGGDYIYSASSDASNLGFSDKLPATQIERYEWKISFVERQISKQNTDKVTALSCLSNYSSRCLDINWSATPVRYATYKYDVNNNAPSFLYKKTFDLSVNANTAGYATAYTAFPYVMPASADGYIVTETAEGETIKAKNKYPAGTEVPAYAPLLIKNAEADVTLNPVVLGKTVEAYPYAEENLLHGTRLESDGVTTDVDGTGTNTANYYYYKLSYKLEPGNPVAYGFYRGKADGSAFAMKNTLTAYLALPRSSGLVNNLRISIDNEEGTTTGIQANRIPADNMPQSIYTLSGVRVNAAGGSLPKGIYIVNGKKVVIK